MSNKPITRKEMFMAKASGQSVNTPKPITREEKFLEQIAENGGKANSWKDLGEKTVMGDTLTWDGDKDGHYNINDVFYHVSDIVPTLEELRQGGTVGVVTGEPLSFNSESVQIISDSLVAIITNDNITVIVALTDNITMDSGEDIPTVFEKAGVYFSELGVGETQVRSLTINGYNGFPRTEITPLPNRYLDFIETVGGDTLTWDGNTEGLEVGVTVFPEGESYNLYRISDATPTREDFANGFSVTIQDVGTDEYENDEGLFYMAENVLDVNGYVLIAYEDNISFTSSEADGGEELSLPKKGIYTSSDVGGFSLTIPGYTEFPKEQVKQEYLPSGGNIFKAINMGENVGITAKEIKAGIEAGNTYLFKYISEEYPIMEVYYQPSLYNAEADCMCLDPIAHNNKYNAYLVIESDGTLISD